MHDTIFSVREGERVSVMMHNMTGMSHPMNLHGHYFQVTPSATPDRGRSARRGAGTPMETVTITFDADNRHMGLPLHHAYHMNAGMMGTISYTSAA